MRPFFRLRHLKGFLHVKTVPDQDHRPLPLPKPILMLNIHGKAYVIQSLKLIQKHPQPKRDIDLQRPISITHMTFNSPHKKKRKISLYINFTLHPRKGHQPSCNYIQIKIYLKKYQIKNSFFAALYIHIWPQKIDQSDKSEMRRSKKRFPKIFYL